MSTLFCLQSKRGAIFFFLVSFLFLICVVVFSSCSEDKISMVASESKLVLDFDSENQPLQRLSVFAEFSSNVRRLEYITVKNSAYSWTIEEPLFIESNDKMWGGYMHLEPPPHLKVFPKGVYEFECVDATGEKAQGNFSVDYSDNLIKADFSNALFADNDWKKLVTVYSENSELLYFGEPKEEWVNDAKIFSSVKDSFSLRRVFESASMICLGPKKFKRPNNKGAL